MAYTEPRSYTFVNKDEPNGALAQNKIFADDLNTLVGNSRDANTRIGTLEAGSTDAQLRDRSTHTGTQPISTVTNLQATLDAKVVAVTTGAKLWIGTQAAYDAIGTKDATTLYAITS